ncbi:hypothetical protein EJB05_22786 [Eragrostis curvula]|uniref:Uncharacterized protein n=1 Tax=Eragrostis curvula TaxID=38414 RepID=A0A5J9V5A9_9POAL|nr:hypothetical protein EJB05_22786 [Eragrostis curvula]
MGQRSREDSLAPTIPLADRDLRRIDGKAVTPLQSAAAAIQGRRREGAALLLHRHCIARPYYSASMIYIDTHGFLLFQRWLQLA